MARIKKQDVPFAQIANAVLNDKQLSIAAKGVYAYLFSKPDGWEFASARIAEDHKDGKRAILAALRELEELGYLQRTRLPSGKMDYQLAFTEGHSFSASNAPKVDIASVRLTLRASNALIKNTEGERNTERGKSKEEEKREEVKKNKNIHEVIEAFRAVNPLVNGLFARTSERKAAERMLAVFPLQALLDRIKMLPKTNAQRFAPKITKPTALENKMGELDAFIVQETMARVKSKLEQGWYVPPSASAKGQPGKLLHDMKT